MSTCSLFTTAQTQPADSVAVPSKVRNVAIAGGAVYGLALVGLNQAWYADFPRSSFHFFNDNKEWMQLDKAGHLYSAFHLSRTGIMVLERSGVSRSKALLWGGLLGTIILTPIEVLDGFSEEYGASWGDALANTAGSALAVGQYLIWDEVRVRPKYSFQSTSFAGLRPNVLGDGFHEEFLKDYNGQTYWLSVDIYAFTGPQSRFPKWLNLAIGYGANNLIYAHKEQNQQAGFDPYRQYYLGLDVDLSHFKTNSKVFNTFLYLVDLIRLPAPALEYNRVQGFKFHTLAF